MGVRTKERKGISAEVLMATPFTNSLGGESGGQKHEGLWGAQALLEVRHRFLVGSGRPSMLIRSAAALGTMSPAVTPDSCPEKGRNPC